MDNVARVFAENITRDDNIYSYCCIGIHVTEHWHWLGPSLKRRVVSPCNGSCKDGPILRKRAFSKKEIVQLKALPLGEESA